VNREIYKEIIETVMNLIEDHAKEFELELESKYDSKRGFTIRLLVAHAKGISLDELPDVFINKIRNKR
jgi:hypothetical protein